VDGFVVVHQSLRRTLPVLVLGATLLIVTSVTILASVSTAVRAAFLVVAALVSLPSYYWTRDSRDTAPDHTGLSERTRVKSLLVLAAAATAGTVVLGGRLVPVGLFLVVGYALVVSQIRPGATSSLVVLQAGVLFAVPLLGTYLDTGVFFGGGDTFGHLRAVNALVAEESIRGIVNAEIGYGNYPAYHLVVGTLKVVGGLPTYESILAVGVVLSSFLVAFAYLAAAGLFERHDVVLGVSVAVSVLSPLGYYALYYFPQSLAVFLLFVGLFLYVRLQATTTVASGRRYTVLVVTLVALMAVTHHLTYLFFVAILATGIVLVAVRRLLSDRGVVPPSERRRERRFGVAFPLLFGVVSLLSYWIYGPSIFLNRFVARLEEAGGSDSVGLVLFGVQPVEDLALAVGWLTSVDALYVSLLAAMILVSVYELLDHPGQYRRAAVPVGLGVLSALTLLPLPVSIPGLRRFAVVATVFVVLPVGVAVARIARADSRTLVALVVIVSVLGATGPFVAPTGNDLDGVGVEERRIQVAYSEQEYEELSAASGFPTSDARLSTRFLTLRAMAVRGMSTNRLGTLRVTERAVLGAPGLVLLREQWTDHYVTARGGRFAVSPRRYRATVARHDKVYQAGGVTVVWQPSGRVRLFNETRAATNATSRKSR